MAEFTLSKLEGAKNDWRGSFNFTQTIEYKIGMGIFLSFYLISSFSPNFGFSRFVLPGFFIALLGFAIAGIPYTISKSAGKVLLGKISIHITPKKHEKAFPDSPINLEHLSEIEINTVSSFRWFSSYLVLQCVIRENGSESFFGIVIKNREQEKQYLEVLESWYRTGYPIKEYNVQGVRVFKIDQGKSYEDIQKIKTNYKLDW